MCGNLKLQSTPHPINPWLSFLYSRLHNAPMLKRRNTHTQSHDSFFPLSHSPERQWLSLSRCPKRKCVNREIDSWLRGLKCNRMENGTMNKWMNTTRARETSWAKKKNEMQNRTAFWMWADKRHFELSSTLAVFYYAINDHALLKSCIYFVSVSLFMFAVPFLW